MINTLFTGYHFVYFTGEMLNIKALLNKEVNMDIGLVIEVMLDIHNATYHNPNVQALLDDTSEQFDLVIAEWMFSELYAG